jgi:hypothetical protein
VPAFGEFGHEGDVYFLGQSGRVWSIRPRDVSKCATLVPFSRRRAKCETPALAPEPRGMSPTARSSADQSYGSSFFRITQDARCTFHAGCRS